MKKRLRSVKMSKNFKKMLSYYKPYRCIFWADMFFATVSAAVALAIPLVIRYVTYTLVYEDKAQIMFQIKIIAAALFGRNDNESFMYCIIVLIITLYSSYVMYKNQRPDKERISYVALIVMVAAYISGTAYGCSTVRETAVLAAAAFASLSEYVQN